MQASAKVQRSDMAIIFSPVLGCAQLDTKPDTIESKFDWLSFNTVGQKKYLSTLDHLGSKSLDTL